MNVRYLNKQLYSYEIAFHYISGKKCIYVYRLYVLLLNIIKILVCVYFIFQARLYALNQIRELLSTQQELQEKSDSQPTTLTTLLCSVHVQLLSGCFSFGSCFNFGSSLDMHVANQNAQLYHYQVINLDTDIFFQITKIKLSILRYSVS